MGAPGSELLGRKRQCSLGGRRGEGSSWVHFSAPNAFSELGIFGHCVSRKGVNDVERYQDWRLNDVLPAGNEQYRVNQTSVHCKTCGIALGRVLRASNTAKEDDGAGLSSGAGAAAAGAGSSGGAGSSAGVDAAAVQEQEKNVLLVSLASRYSRLAEELKLEKKRKSGRCNAASPFPLRSSLCLFCTCSGPVRRGHARILTMCMACSEEERERLKKTVDELSARLRAPRTGLTPQDAQKYRETISELDAKLRRAEGQLREKDKNYFKRGGKSSRVWGVSMF